MSASSKPISQNASLKDSYPYCLCGSVKTTGSEHLGFVLCPNIVLVDANAVFSYEPDDCLFYPKSRGGKPTNGSYSVNALELVEDSTSKEKNLAVLILDRSLIDLNLFEKQERLPLLAPTEAELNTLPLNLIGYPVDNDGNNDEDIVEGKVTVICSDLERKRFMLKSDVNLKPGSGFFAEKDGQKQLIGFVQRTEKINDKKNTSFQTWVIGFNTKSDLDINKSLEIYANQLVDRGIELIKDSHNEDALKWFTRAAAFGSVKALKRIGSFHYLGIVGKIDYEQAFTYFWKANSRLETFATEDFGGLASNPDDVERILNKASEQGILHYQYALGYFYEFHRSNIDLALTWYEKSASNGYLDSQVKVASYYTKGSQKNERLAAGWYERAAEKGNPEALFNVAQYYLTQSFNRDYFRWKPGCKKIDESSGWYPLVKLSSDESENSSSNETHEKYEPSLLEFEKALDFYTRAAEKGHTKAQLVLGRFYRSGAGNKKKNNTNYKKAFEYLSKAAKEGDREAQYCLAKAFIKARGVKFNMTEGIHWLEKSSSNNYPMATYALARVYFDGNPDRRLKPSYFKAHEWLEKLPAELIPSAHEIIGLMYASGLGTEISKENALKNLEKAADLGSKTANYHLATIYLIVKDYPAAIHQLQKVNEGMYLCAAKTARGWLSLNGYGVEKSDKDALELFAQASSGDAVGKWYYASCLENAIVTKTPGTKSPKEWYTESKAELSPEKRWPKSQEWLPLELAYWVEKAAHIGGNARPKVVLAQMYERGIGFVPSRDLAIEWYKKAIQSGYKPNEDIKKLLKESKTRDNCYYCVIF